MGKNLNTQVLKYKKAIKNQTLSKNEVNYASTELLDNDQFILKREKINNFVKLLVIKIYLFKVLLMIWKQWQIVAWW